MARATTRPKKICALCGKECDPRFYYSGMCGLCAHAAGVVVLKQLPRESDDCLGCHRPLRPRKYKLEDRPGTVAYFRDSMCKACWRKADAARASD